MTTLVLRGISGKIVHWRGLNFKNMYVFLPKPPFGPMDVPVHTNVGAVIPRLPTMPMFMSTLR